MKRFDMWNVVIYTPFPSSQGVHPVVTALAHNGYSGGMIERKRRPTPAKQPREYPNRIRELNKERGYTYDSLAAELGVHPKTIGALATGDAELTLTWMQRLANVYGVKPIEIIERQVMEGLRSVVIGGKVQAGVWADNHAFDPQDRRTVTVPNDPDLKGLDLYAREIEGESMNKLYAHGSVVVLSRLAQRPGEIIAGKRYHVARTRGDVREETIKTLVRDRAGDYWLQPESDSPEFTAFKLAGDENETVELLGRVRYALTVE